MTSCGYICLRKVRVSSVTTNPAKDDSPAVCKGSRGFCIFNNVFNGNLKNTKIDREVNDFYNGTNKQNA